MFGCECYISGTGMHSYLLIWIYNYPKKLKYHSRNDQNRNSGEMTSLICEIYNNTVTIHGNHIPKTAT